MSRYVDGFVIPIKKKNLNAYKKMATVGRNTWMKHGALEYYECVGSNAKSEWGVPFSQLCKLKADETVVFAFVVYKSKAHREKVNKKVHLDLAKLYEDDKNFEMPFDMKRMTVGEFNTLVYAK